MKISEKTVIVQLPVKVKTPAELKALLPIDWSSLSRVGYDSEPVSFNVIPPSLEGIPSSKFLTLPTGEIHWQLEGVEADMRSRILSVLGQFSSRLSYNFQHPAFRYLLERIKAIQLEDMTETILERIKSR